MWAWPPSPPPSERPSPRARVSACARDEVCILPDLIHASAHALSGRASAGRLFPPPDSAFVRSGRIRGVPPGVRCHCTCLKFNILPYLTLSQASRAPSRRLRLSRSATSSACCVAQSRPGGRHRHGSRSASRAAQAKGRRWVVASVGVSAHANHCGTRNVVTRTLDMALGCEQIRHTQIR